MAETATQLHSMTIAQAEVDLAETRFRGERRLGELMAAQRDAGLMAKGANPNWVEEKPDRPITLAEAGIDKNLADRARKYAGSTRGILQATAKFLQGPGWLNKQPKTARAIPFDNGRKWRGVRFLTGNICPLLSGR